MDPKLKEHIEKLKEEILSKGAPKLGVHDSSEYTYDSEEEVSE